MNVDRDSSKDLEAADDAISALVFRVKGRWLALPTTLVRHVTEPTMPHTIPGRTDSCFRGIVNAGGELTLCFSLAELLGIEGYTAGNPEGKGRPCLIVMGEADNRVAFAVDDILGVQAFSFVDQKPFPEAPYMPGRCEPVQIIAGDRVEAGLLDERLLWDALNRSLHNGAG